MTKQTRSHANSFLNCSGFRTQSQAVAIDEELMGPLGFSVDQLMELAGSMAT